jgi:hypothetical protein
MSWWKMRVLMAPKDEKPGAGGNGGGGDDDDDDIDPKIARHVGKAVNSAVRDYMKRSSFKDALGASIADVVKPMFEELGAKLKPAAGGGGAGDDDDRERGGGNGGGDKSKGGLPPEVQRELEDQKRMIKRLTDENAKSAAERDAAKKRNDEAEERKVLADALKKHGVDETRLDGAVALLYADRKRVVRDKEGKIRFALPREGFVDEVDVESGAAEWVKSSEGKAYLPPRDVEGGGQRGGRAPVRSGNGEPSVPELADELAHLMAGGKPRINLG